LLGVEEAHESSGLIVALEGKPVAQGLRLMEAVALVEVVEDTRPFAVGKGGFVECRELRAQVVFECRLVFDGDGVKAKAGESLDQGLFELCFGLVGHTHPRVTFLSDIARFIIGKMFMFIATKLTFLTRVVAFFKHIGGMFITKFICFFLNDSLSHEQVEVPPYPCFRDTQHFRQFGKCSLV